MSFTPIARRASGVHALQVMRRLPTGRASRMTLCAVFALLALPAAATAAPPPNDNFANAIALPGTVPASTTGTNVEATFETGEVVPLYEVNAASVWWSWTAPATQNVTLSLCGSDFDTVLGVFTGTAVDAARLCGLGR